ncbi:hypothetical protein LXA43DRAFT_902748, partial [Ganoderma leucocontextum]
KKELATYNGLFIKLINDYPDDEHTVKITIAVLSTVQWFIFCQVDPPSSSLIKRMSLPDVVRAAVAVLRPPLNPERSVLLHALQLLVAPTEHCSDECRANPSLMSILAAVTRSKSLSARITAVHGLMGVHPSKFESQRTRFPLLEVLRSSSLKHHLGRLLLGAGQSYTIDLIKDLNAYSLLLKKLAQPTCDLYAVGKGLADLVQRHDYVVSELVDDTNTGRVSVYFPEWLERFVSCARELRTRATSDADRDLADVLEMKVLILRGRVTKAKALGKRAIVRNPSLAYAYYVVARGSPTEEGLRVAKLGLRCSRASSFTRSQLLWVALEFAARIGLTLHGTSDDSDPRVPSLFSSALKDARTFMAEAPWDHPSTGIVLSWMILLTLTLFSPQSTRRQLGQIAELTALLGYDDLDVQLRRTQEFLCQEYDHGLQDWDHVVEGLGGRDADVVHSAPELDIDDLSWIRELQGCSGWTERPDKLGADELYRCSWCRKACARPKKCLGCKAAIYCNSNCQKSHWPAHKDSCAREDRFDPSITVKPVSNLSVAC